MPVCETEAQADATAGSEAEGHHCLLRLAAIQEALSEVGYQMQPTNPNIFSEVEQNWEQCNFWGDAASTHSEARCEGAMQEAIQYDHTNESQWRHC